MKKIAIQGIKGSFHDIAAHQYFHDDDVELICCNTFEDIFRQMRDDYSRLGLMAIENTIAGSLLHNYELLRERPSLASTSCTLSTASCVCPTTIGTPSPRLIHTPWP